MDGVTARLDLAALEQHAAQATGKAWNDEQYQTIGDWGDNLDEHDHALIAACDPATIQALVRAVQAALEMADALDSAWDDQIHIDRAAQDELDAALAPFRKEQP